MSDLKGHTATNAAPPASPIATTCPYCGVGCGVLAAPQPDGTVTIKGDPDHPANHGRLCSKGAALGETLDLDGRLLFPEIRGRRVGWDEALDHLAGEFSRIIREHGPGAVGFYVSGQLLTEDYYVANKLMKGFIGSANIDTNSRLCMSSSVAGHKRAFGSDTVPCSYEDLELADLLVLAGSNAAWCHPVLWQRMLESRRRRPQVKIVVIDPRRTATAEDADLFLPIRPGTDAILFNGLLDHLRRDDALDLEFLENHAEGHARALAAARETAPSIPAVAAACDLPEADVAAFYRSFARSEKAVTLYSQGVNQSASGTDKVNSIINCHLATGRIGRPGMGPFSLTGQPNAMGGREVGGLANQLAAHMDIDNASHRALVQRFWGSPRIAGNAGLQAVDMFNAVAGGDIKAVWIVATNPVVSMPDADAVRAALAGCELVVVSDCVRHTDTTAVAHVLLPALAWGEKDGTVTNSERRISRQRPFLAPPGEARPDWWIIAQVARRMGFADAFAYASPAAIFREHAALSGVENSGVRAFDISGVATLSDAGYDALQPIQWPSPSVPRRGAAAEEDGGMVTNPLHSALPAAEHSCSGSRGTAQGAAMAGTPRMFTDRRFFTPSGKARFVPVVPRSPANVTSAEYPLVLNTGRVRDHWHTLTRTGKSSRLSAHTPEPYAEIHPDDARRGGILDGMLVRVSSRWGSVVGRARVSDRQKPGNVFVPMHWSDCQASEARVDAAVNPAVDPVSGQPELKHTPVRVESMQPLWEAVLIVPPEHLGMPPADRWVRVRGQGCTHLELAGGQWPVGGVAGTSAWLPRTGCEGEELIEYLDVAAGRYRAAVIRAGRIRACLYVAPAASTRPALDWIGALFATGRSLTAEDRLGVLSGRPRRAGADAGPTICACFNVGRNAIAAAVGGGCRSVEEVGAALKAGTHCGSCRPEIRQLIDALAAAG